MWIRSLFLISIHYQNRAAEAYLAFELMTFSPKNVRETHSIGHVAQSIRQGHYSIYLQKSHIAVLLYQQARLN